MALSILRLPRARLDADEIWLSIAADSLQAADRIVSRIYDAETRLADFPELGRARDDLRPGMRSWSVGSYLIFYRVEAARLVVVRILHGARDLPDLPDET